MTFIEKECACRQDRLALSCATSTLILPTPSCSESIGFDQWESESESDPRIALPIGRKKKTSRDYTANTIKAGCALGWTKIVKPRQQLQRPTARDIYKTRSEVWHLDLPPHSVSLWRGLENDTICSLSKLLRKTFEEFFRYYWTPLHIYAEQ